MSVAGVLTGQEPAAPYRFEVVVDGVPLGSFTACEGLNAEYEMKEVMEGGVNGYIQRLPGRLKHANVKLSRPLFDEETESVVPGQTSRLPPRSSFRVAACEPA